jgi:hypothetical protein
MSRQPEWIGIAWYVSEKYDAVRRVMADGHQLPDSFDVWRTKAEHREKELRGLGQVVVRAVIDPETFPDWCRSRGLNVDSQARMLFASLVAKERQAASDSAGRLH